MSVVMRPMPDCDTEFNVNHWGGIDICRVNRHGEVTSTGRSEKIDVARDPEGRLTISVIFFNGHPTVSLGTAVIAGAHYMGRGKDQLVCESISVDVGLHSEIPQEEQICLIDVGAAGGLQSAWRARRGLIRPVAFEPNPKEAASIRAVFTSFSGGLVIVRGLFSEDAAKTLYLTRVPGCSSVFRPNKALLSRYAIAPAFEVLGEIRINCSRYDTLFHAGEVPAPDVIKLDVQGAELNVLHGFGAQLTPCLGIEVETHTYPIYHGQALLADIISYLDLYGFSLRRIVPQMNFDGDAVEFDAYFTKRLDQLPGPRERALRKLDVIDEVWNLTRPDHGARLAANALDL